MSTHTISFYEDLSKIILQLSLNFIKYAISSSAYLLSGRIERSSPCASSHSPTYSFNTVRARIILVVSCITRLLLSLSFSRTVTVSYRAFSLSTVVWMKSSWISFWFWCSRGPRLVNVSFSSTIAFSATSSGAQRIT